MEINYGYKPSPPSIKDYVSKAVIPTDMDLANEESFNWLDKIPSIRDQIEFGCCVGFSSIAIKNVQEKVEGDLPNGGLSPLFVYTMCKKFDGIPDEEGTYPRTALDVLRKYGVSSETTLPYSLLEDINKLPEITNDMLNQALPFRIKEFARIPDGDLQALKQALKISPVLAAVLVTDDFINCEEGFVNSPGGFIRGGHAISFVGWDDNLEHTFKNGKTKKGFILFQNSWGTVWGNNGIGYIAYEDLNWESEDLGMKFVEEMWCVTDLVTATVQKHYKVQIGKYKILKNAKKLAEKLKNAGYDIYIPPADATGHYCVQVGSFLDKNLAKNLRKQMSLDGFHEVSIIYS